MHRLSHSRSQSQEPDREVEQHSDQSSPKDNGEKRMLLHKAATKQSLGPAGRYQTVLPSLTERLKLLHTII